MMHSLENDECRLCSGSNIKHILTTKRDSYFLCEECGLLQKTQFPNAEYEESRYHVHENFRNNIYYHKYIKEIADNFVLPQLETYSKNTARVLDYGCGQDPYLSDFLQAHAKEVINYDYFFHPESYNGSFDVITMIEVAEHLHTPLPVFKELLSSLNTGGKLLVQTEPYPNENLKGWGYKEDDTHVIFYNDKVMTFLEEQLNCIVKKISHKRWMFEK